jgi:hypothetical protein
MEIERKIKRWKEIVYISQNLLEGKKDVEEKI